MRVTQLPLLVVLVTSLGALGQSANVPVPAGSQTATPKLAATPSSANDTPSADAYSGEPVVIEKLATVYSMTADGTGYKVTTVVAHVQSDAFAKQLGVVSVAFASNTEHIELQYVRVRRPDGTVTETPVTEAIEMPSPVTTAAPFYSDLKQLQIPVRNLHVGDHLEWQAKFIETKALAPGQFWGQESFVPDAVVLSQTVELRVPKDMYVNVWSPAQPAHESIEDGQHVFRWEASQKKPTVGKEADAENERKKKQVWTPEQELDAKEGKLPDIAWTTFKTWDAVGAWYASLENDRVTPDAEVKAKVAEVIAGKTSEAEKVQAVYGYVATQIRYIGVGFGIGRYQPHKASEVLENQYGDCKDKHTLLAAMLTALGLHPSAVLIGAGVRFNDAVPSPSAFNHLITTVSVNGQPVWLDSTAEVAPYAALEYGIRDKQALVVPESGTAKIERTPANLPFESISTMNAEGSLDKDGVSDSRLTLTARGDAEIAIRAAFRQTSPSQYDELVQNMSRAIGYAGTTSHAEIGHLEDTSLPFSFSYDYKRDKAGDWDNYRIIPQVMPAPLPTVDENDPPVQAISLGVPHTETSNAAMKLPDGWSAVLPEAVHSKSVYATYDETYRFEKGTLYTERKIVILQEKVPVSEWKSYKKWTDEVSLGNETYIQLTGMESKSSAKNGTAPAIGDEAAGATKDSSVTSHADAAKLVASAYEAMQRNDADDARRQLDDAKQINPTQAWLWAIYGYLELQRYQLPTAVEDFQKELAHHPETYDVYSSLAMSQKTLNQPKDALETLRKWESAQPESPRPIAMLMAMQVDAGDAAEAVSEGETAIARLPEDKRKDEGLQIVLGRAELKAGMKEKGGATLFALMQSTDDPELMNDSAYQLADESLHLPEAETATNAALRKLDEESDAWTLDEDPLVLLGKSNLLVATWDTMGWIYYREGKLDLAQDYVQAAWRYQQNSVVGEHLGEIEEAAGQKDAALKTYALAVATIPAYDVMGVRKPPNPEQEALIDRTAVLRKTILKVRAPDSTDDLHANLIKLRTIPLGPEDGMTGSAEYSLLIGSGKVLKAEPVNGKDIPNGKERVLTANLTGFWPKVSSAQLVRRAALNCHGQICELILEP